MFTAFRFSLVLVVAAIPGGGLAFAQPQLPNYAPLVAGRARYTDAKAVTPAPLPDAKIEVWLKKVLVMETQTDDEGAFKLDRLPYPAAGDGFIVVARPAREDADLGVAATVFVLPGDNAGALVSNVELMLKPAQTRRIRIEKLADKTPVVGATVGVLQLNVALPGGGGNWPLPTNGLKPQFSDAEGIVELTGVPTGALAELRVSADEYADNIVRLKQNEAGATVPLALESRVFGRVTLNGDEPLDVPQWQIKMQGLRGSWRNHWRTDNLDGKGEYVIENVAPPAIIGESSYLINLELNRIFAPRPGVRADYMPPQGGYDVMVTLQREGQTRRYITYISQARDQLKFGEGSDVRHDLNLEPMALVVGQTQPNATVSYLNPRSRYRKWEQQADARGRFEVPVPVGDLKLQVGARALELKDLKAHETRDAGQID